MRKLTKSKKEIITLESINSSCACVEYCGSHARDNYKRIQEHLARTGDPVPFGTKKDI